MTARSRNPSSRRRAHVPEIVALVVLLLGSAAATLPMIYVLSVSFKKKGDIIKPASLSFMPTLDNYRDLFERFDFGKYLINSAIVSVAAVLVTVTLACMAAYGLTRFGLRKERAAAFGFLSMGMIPAISVVIPYYLIAQLTGLIDTYLVLIVSYTSGSLPLAIWMLRGFFRQIPMEVDDAAQIDGASRMRTLLQLHIPIVTPGITSTALVLLIQLWNEFIFAQFLTSIKVRTVPTTASLFMSIAGTNFGAMAAAIIVATLPMLIVVLAFQRRLVTGLAFGAV
jgi:multiple sugar transport system permease protein